jgi:hypothetical protein
MYLEFAIKDKFLFKEKEIMRVPLCVSLQTDKEYFPDAKHEPLPEQSGDDY